MKLTELSNTSTERVLITGLPGSGKSTLAAKLSANFNLIWIDLENSISSLRKLPISYQERINVISLPDSASYPVASETLLQLFKNGKGKICAAHGKYNCAICIKEGKHIEEIDFSALGMNDIVVLDTASQLSASILAHTMKGKDVTAKPERDDWGAVRKYTEYFTSQFQAANFNLIVIAHALEAEMEDGKKKLVSSFGSRDMSASFGKAFDHVIYCDVINKKHKAFSSSTYSNGILTKSRTGFEIEKLAEPSLDEIFRKTQVLVVAATATNKENGDAGKILSGLAENRNVTQAKQIEKEVLEDSSARQAAKTPGQIALDNLRAKKAAEAAAKKVGG